MSFIYPLPHIRVKAYYNGKTGADIARAEFGNVKCEHEIAVAERDFAAEYPDQSKRSQGSFPGRCGFVEKQTRYAKYRIAEPEKALLYWIYLLQQVGLKPALDEIDFKRSDKPAG
jgi:hypothetical protein